VEVIVPVNVVRVKFNFNGLPDHLVRESGLGGEDDGVLDLDTVAQANAEFSYS
jgi:hypothetical protein